MSSSNRFLLERPPLAVAVTDDEGAPTVEILAPSDLPEGYVFDAVANGKTITVTVPEGGVRRDETFSAPFVPGSAIPEGRWRDDISTAHVRALPPLAVDDNMLPPWFRTAWVWTASARENILEAIAHHRLRFSSALQFLAMSGP
ncbi:hypothetical protein THAOC_35384 [Thalassiosira oceanica]|uniref:Uncharacterized protein n=1 Tax=Thalassiosira oceanica TaxID=159749 RepID=K0RH69_THAOC|nr:hypothetical protein THAOC_35384 [Thalassiosira oceanica]|eukprot:EJK45972.1 hypothetical protein THAOC_35384 [Thalassiosira oceanica]